MDDPPTLLKGILALKELDVERVSFAFRHKTTIPLYFRHYG